MCVCVCICEVEMKPREEVTRIPEPSLFNEVAFDEDTGVYEIVCDILFVL